MSIGDKWAAVGFGAMDKESSFKLLDAYFEAGGNFIDTASNYQDGSSEAFIGEWMQERGIRDQIVLATKYTNSTKRADPTIKTQANYVGNNLKNLRISVANSLKLLNTDYIDILYVHYWDLHSSVEEIMDGIHQLVLAGKVLYLGISDAPAWFVVKANDYAKYNGKTPFVVYQAAYSVVERDIEREILPMCRHEGIALTLWNVLAGGHIRTDADEEARSISGEKGRSLLGDWQRNESEKKMCAALEKVAEQVGAKHITAVAIAYTMHKAPFVFPIIGGRKVEHLQANMEALSISLSPEQVKFIDDVLPFDVGFPAKLIGQYGTYPWLITAFAHFDIQPLQAPIPHGRQ